MRRITSSPNRLLAFAVTASLVGSVAACGESEDEGDRASTGAPPPSVKTANDERRDKSPDTGRAVEDRQSEPKPAAGEERISAIVSGMYGDFAAGDAEGVCSVMSESARESIAQGVIGGSTEAPEDRTCEASFSKFVKAAAGSGLLEGTRRGLRPLVSHGCGRPIRISREAA